MLNIRLALIFPLLLVASAAAAQPPSIEPLPLWDVQLGAAFVGTSGNSETTTAGGDFSLRRRGEVWSTESTAIVVRATNHNVSTAERYLGAIRASRKLSLNVGLSAGERAERDRLAGIDVRSILDGGLSWVLRRDPTWTLDGVTAIAWDHERTTRGVVRDDPIGVFQLASRVPLGIGADSTQRFTYYPDFSDSHAYRSEAEITAQAAMTSRLALKLGYLWRYSNAPVPGFRKTDNTTTASLVVRWKSVRLAPL